MTDRADAYECHGCKTRHATENMVAYCAVCFSSERTERERLEARCRKHEGHEHCVTPCDSIRIQEQNHSAWQLAVARAEAAESRLETLRQETQKIIDDMKAEHQKLFQANSAMSARLAKAEKVIERLFKMAEHQRQNDPRTGDPFDGGEDRAWGLEQAADLLVEALAAHDGEES